jgi:hypothetical protein
VLIASSDDQMIGEYEDKQYGRGKCLGSGFDKGERGCGIGAARGQDNLNTNLSYMN